MIKNIFKIYYVFIVLFSVLFYQDVFAKEKNISKSIYTVEFNYNNSEYVLNGDCSVELDVILDKLNIKGNITSVNVSDSTLFNVYKQNNSYYLTALKPFNTTEWMDINIQGFNHRIIVTDDFIGYNGTSVQTFTNVPLVEQGGNEHNFTKSMPVATIFIDEDIIGYSTDKNEDVARREAAKKELLIDTNLHPGFIFKNPTVYTGSDDSVLSFHMGKEKLNTTVNDGINDTFFEGDIIKYTFVDGAYVIDPLSGEKTYYDVEIVYSNLHISLQSDLTKKNYNYMISGDNSESEADPENGVVLGLFQANRINLGLSLFNGGDVSTSTDNGKNSRYGINVDANIRVVEKTPDSNGIKQPISGSYYYQMSDLDVLRDTSSFAKLYDASNNRSYSEQVQIDASDLITGVSGAKIYIPGGDFNSYNEVDGATNMPYLSGIEQNDNKILVYPNGSYKNLINPETGANRDNDLYTGFASLVENDANDINSKGGLNLKFWGASPANKNGIVSYLLTGTHNINHLLVSSTDRGGTIKTTRYGNHSGNLDDGGELYDATVGNSKTIVSATGQTIVYTMKPELGYRLKSVKINETSENINDEGTFSITPTPVYEEDGVTVKYYTFEFADISSNGSIHVEWEALELTVSKHTIGPNVVNDVFTFEIYAEKDGDYLDFSNISDKTFTHKGNNIYEFTLTNEEKYTFPEAFIPYGYRWNITETKLGVNDGWEIVGNANQSELIDYRQKAEFTNKRGEIKDNTIYVQKVWENDDKNIRPDELTINISRRYSMLVDGVSFKTKMLSLTSSDNDIKKFLKGNKTDFESSSNSIKVSTSDSTYDTYLYFDDVTGTVYYYSEAKDVFLNVDATSMFDSLKSLEDISGLSEIRTDYTENFTRMFANCYKISDLSPLANWNVTNAKNMAKILASMNVSGDPTKHNAMSYTDLNPLKDWNVKNLEDASYMFRGAKITSVAAISQWETINVKTINNMFFRSLVEDAEVLKVWDASHITDFGSVFKTGTTNTYSGTLPIFNNRSGSWNKSTGNYTPSSLAVTTHVDTPMNENHLSNEVISKTAHVEEMDNVWLYEFTITDDNLEWDIWEDVPDHYDVYQSNIKNKGSVSDKVVGKEKETTVLTNKRKLKDITFKKHWIDEDNIKNKRPDSINGFIKYEIGTGSNKETYILNTVSSLFEKEGNIWSYTFKIPDNATVVDWGEELVPDNYKFKKIDYVDNDIYEISNTITDLELNIKKVTTGNLADVNKSFPFTIKVKDENNNLVEKLVVKVGNNKEEVVQTSSGYQVLLKHNESIIIYNLGKNYTYEVSENNYNYTPSYKIFENSSIKKEDNTNNTGSITITDNNNIIFYNNYEKSIETNIKSNNV